MEFERNKIESLIAPVVEAMGYIVWYVELHRAQRKAMLRIYVDVALDDKRKSVTLDDCGYISKQIGALLDVEGCAEGSYVLEISSPGLDRSLFKLEHYKRYVGSMVRIVLNSPKDGRTNFTGKILDLFDDSLNLEVDGETVTLELSNIYKAKLI